MDAADILGAPRPSTEFKARSRREQPPDIKGAKLQGLKREVYHLTGRTLEANEERATSPHFGKKRAPLQRKKKGVKWEDYPFARFNKKAQLLHYNDEEYEKLLNSDEWTRNQTDALMTLVERFHLNFTLVQDRWEGTGSVDALKDRFYDIQRKLYQSRDLPPLPEDMAVLLTRPFNRQWEEDRKRAMSAVSQRSKEEEKEEGEVLEKARKIEAALKRRRLAEKSAFSRSKTAHAEEKKAVPAVGGIALRSTMFAGTEREAKRMGAVLDAIGLQLPNVSHDPELNAAVSSLREDLHTLLSWHQRREELREAPGTRGGSSSKETSYGGGGGGGAGSEAFENGEERSAKKARKSAN